MTLWPKIILGALILAALSWAVIEIRQDGAQSVRNTIERQNNEAGGNADDARSEFDRCPDGMWDYGGSRCRGTTPRRRN